MRLAVPDSVESAEMEKPELATQVVEAAAAILDRQSPRRTSLLLKGENCGVLWTRRSRFFRFHNLWHVSRGSIKKRED